MFTGVSANFSVPTYVGEAGRLSFNWRCHGCSVSTCDMQVTIYRGKLDANNNIVSTGQIVDRFYTAEGGENWEVAAAPGTYGFDRDGWSTLREKVRPSSISATTTAVEGNYIKYVGEGYYIFDIYAVSSGIHPQVAAICGAWIWDLKVQNTYEAVLVDIDRYDNSQLKIETDPARNILNSKVNNWL